MAGARKCLVWDLDNTLWNGVCLEGPVTVPEASRRTIIELDRRGVLHSIASRGESAVSWPILEANGLDSFFLAPRINWLPKPTNIAAIARELGLGLDAFAFVDDDPFEREQVEFMLPKVLTIDAADREDIPTFPEFMPGEVTSVSRRRRELYRAELARQEAAGGYSTRKEFLESCSMRLRVQRAVPGDVPRIRELMTRTHQLNTTGLLLAEGEVREIVARSRSGNDRREMHVAELADRFGDYGIVGVALAEFGRDSTTWIIEYLAMSCRILGRGVERAFLHVLLSTAADHGHSQADFILRETGRNRMMRALCQLMGFREVGHEPDTGKLRFRQALEAVPPAPTWVTVT